MKLTKKRKRVNELVEAGKAYTLEDASNLIKEINTTNFDSSIDLHVRLGVDPKKADQLVRGTASLPHGTGKEKVVLCLCPPEKEDEAKEAGADFFGMDEYLKKIEGGWVEFDVVIATPDAMPKLARLGKVLGPRGLMPNPKSGTVTPNVGAAIADVKKGKIAFKVDKTGIIHAPVGRSSFSGDKLYENASELLQIISKLKPTSSKGTYFKSIYMASTMSPGIMIDTKSVKGV